MKRNRSKLRIEELERRENPAAVNIGFGSGILDFNVAGYTLSQNNANFGTTSSAFGFSEAAMTAPQAVTTANGGTATATLNDAFDGALSWGLALNIGLPVPGSIPANGPLTYYDQDGIVDIVGTPISPNVYGPGTILTGSPNTASFDGDSFNGLQLWQQNAVFAVNGAPVIRTIFYVTNTTGATITQNLGVFNNLGSDGGTEIFDTSSGDFAFSGGIDTYVGSFQAYAGLTSPDPRLMFQVQGGFGAIRQGLDPSSSFVDGDDQARFNFFATLEAGETQAFMIFTGLYGSKQVALDNNADFSSYGDLVANGLLDGLTGPALALIRNWDLAVEPLGEVAGTLAGVESRVQTFAADGTPQLDFSPFPGFTGGVSVARGDVNADGIADILTGSGGGAAGHVRAFNGTDGSEIASFFPFGDYNGGLSVAVGDVDGDGFGDYVVGTTDGSSHVKVFSSRTGVELYSFFAFDGFTGGVNVASADVDGDGQADIVVGTRIGAAHVKVFSGASGAEIRSFFAFDGYTGGISVAAGDLNGDGYADIVVGAQQGATHVKAFSGFDGAELASFFAYQGSLGGVSVAVVDADGDGIADIGTGSRVGNHLKAFRPSDGSESDSFFADNGLSGGIDVG